MTLQNDKAIRNHKTHVGSWGDGYMSEPLANKCEDLSSIPRSNIPPGAVLYVCNPSAFMVR